MDNPWVRIARTCVRPPALGLAGVVVAWWLLLAGAVAWLGDEPTAAATPKPFAAVPGEMARIHQPSVPVRPVAATRAGFNAYQRGIRDNNAVALEEAFVVSEWYAVGHGEWVRVVAVDGDAAQVELLEGGYAGRLAWMTMQELSPPQ